jgi:hypothetical protein
MSFIIAKKGARKSKSQVYISKSARTISFSAGFFRENKIDTSNYSYARLAMDKDRNEIAFDFMESNKGNEDECLKLTFTQSKTAASCPVNSILTTFEKKISDISGTYAGVAVTGPISIPGFSSNAFILRVDYRKG